MYCRTISSISFFLTLLVILLPSGLAAETFGGQVEVGAFELHVQIVRERVVVMERGGSHAPETPATALEAEFLGWDPLSGEVSVSVAIENTEVFPLFAPLSLRATKLAPPTVESLNADAADGEGTWLYTAAELDGGRILAAQQRSQARTLVFHSPGPMDFKVDFLVLAGIPLPAGQGATITNPDGATLTVPPGALDVDALIDIAQVPSSAITAPLEALALVGTVEITFIPVDFHSLHAQPAAPFEISIPSSGNTAGGSFVVTRQLLVDDVTGTEPGLRERLVPVDTAILSGDLVVTDGDSFPGIFTGGTFAIVELGVPGFAPLLADDYGFVTGVVTEGGASRPGAVVSNSANSLVSVADGAGNYQLAVNVGGFTVTAFDPLRGSAGSASGTVPAADVTVAANLAMTQLATPPITRDGIRNSAFERGDLSSWATSGAAATVQQLACTGATTMPTEGKWMADINTGPGSVGAIGSSLKQSFRVPAGVNTLRLDFNFVSEEFPEFVGSIFDDAFRAAITTPSGQTTFAQVSVNNSGGFTLIGNCGFPGGDSTSGMTGWRTASVDLSAFAGTNTPIQVELIFSAVDAGDNIYDTHVLVDNIRFSTLWVDAKSVVGAAANRARAESEVVSANEILSQAGINVRLRGFNAVADPGGLLDTDLTWNYTCTLLFFNCGGERTAEETQLLSLSRSATATDVNAYYVRSVTGAASCARAYGPDDFRGGAFSRLDLLADGGLVIRNTGGGCSAGGHILAHELGHLLISPQRAGDALEHAAGGANFMGGNGGAPLLGVVSRQQSANINRAGAPLLVP